MSNEIERVNKEMKNLFEDPKFARKAWKSIGNAILNSPCIKPIENLDKDGNPTLGSEIEKHSYQKLAADIKALGENREPTELEMIMHCQMIKARYDTNAATFVRDTLGAKPIDETKVEAQLSNPYESLTDEELELIAKHREEAKAVDVPPIQIEDNIIIDS